MRKNKKSLIKRILLFILYIHLFFWITIGLSALIYQFVNPPITILMAHRYLVRGYPWRKRIFMPLEKIPKTSVKMVMTLEDPNFYNHFGIDWNMVQFAWKKNRKAGKIRFGASTISNQLARTIYLTTHRTYFRKYLEIQITVIMELVMTKKRMLELYLNYIEWGKGVYGIESASKYYYKTSVKNLSRDQQMKLVSILTNPIKYSPHNVTNSRSAMQRYNMLQRIY